jgi:hypothetical protein
MTSALVYEELACEEVELLPARETLGLFNVANVTAVNLALAVNAASFASQANALAGQTIAVVQQ